jgi:hypothetical protein
MPWAALAIVTSVGSVLFLASPRLFALLVLGWWLVGMVSTDHPYRELRYVSWLLIAVIAVIVIDGAVDLLFGR